jgi:serine/threonine-protein kinase
VATRETLRSVIDAGRTSRRLDELSAARVIGKVAQQVHAAQQKAGAGKAIGPVSPSAVELAPTGEVSLALPATGAFGYTAPEQLSGGAGDRRSDVFSLGVVMWEALTHQRLFEAMNDAAVKAAVVDREIKAPSEVNANIPAELSAICMRALARNPADRYQSAKSMAVEIEEFLEEAGYADSDDKIAAFLADLGKPREEKKVTLPPANRITAPANEPGSQPSVLTAPTQAPSVLASTAQPPTATPASPGIALANALANAATPASDKSTTSPGLGPSVLVAPAPAANARTANGTAPPPLVPLPPVLPSTTIAGTGAPSRAEVEAEAAKVEAAKAAADAARIESARIEVEKAADAARIESARIEAEKVAKAEADKAADASKADAPPSQAKPAPSQTVLGIGAVVQPPAAAADTAHAATAPDDAAPVAPMAGPPTRPSRPGTSPGSPHPASVVALPQGKDKDVLAGWGWGTDSHQAITDDDLDLPAAHTNNRKLLMYLVGGGIAFTALVAIIAFGFGGSKKKPAPPPAAQTQEWNQIGSATPDSVNGSAGSATLAGSAASATGSADTTAAAGSADTGSAAASADIGSAVAAAGSAVATGSDALATGSASAMVATTAPDTKTPDTKAPDTKAPDTAPPATKVATMPPAKQPPETKTPDAKATAKTAPKPPETKVATTPAKSPKPPVTKTAKTTSATPVDPYAETKTAKPAKPGKDTKVDVETAYRIGLQQFARGDTTGALASLRTSLAGNPNYAPTWRALGLVFEKLGEKDQARAAYKRYLQLAPSAGDAEQIRGRLERLGS